MVVPVELWPAVFSTRFGRKQSNEDKNWLVARNSSTITSQF